MSEDGARTFVLDHEEPISLSEEQAGNQSNGLSRLRVLAVGMAHLNGFMSKVEAEYANRMEAMAQAKLPEAKGKKVRVVAFGNVPEARGLPMPLVECAFQWYAVSAWNYVRTVGWIGEVTGVCGRKAREYAEDVGSAFMAYRDKVAAHFAGATESRRDNEAERQMSMFPPIGWSGDALYANPMKLVRKSKGKVSDSSVLGPWSLSKTHTKLSKRYWPDGVAAALARLNPERDPSQPEQKRPMA
jgi:hypothetical protein